MLGVIFTLAAIAVWLLSRPLTTRQGVNYQQTTRNIPAYVKALDFLQRHYQYKLLASTICADPKSSQECMLAIFRWTRATIRPTPDGWPVIDDHVLHIIIRGHGASDQMADVFSTLSTYAGIPAFWHEFRDRQGRSSVIMSFARLEHGWVPLDVERQVLFADRDGGLATVDELGRNPQLLAAAAGPDTPAYATLLTDRFKEPFVAPDPLRAELHQPWQRLKYEIGQGLRGAR